MSLTVTAGDLTLAAQTSDLRSIPSVSTLESLDPLRDADLCITLELSATSRAVALAHRTGPRRRALSM